MKRIGLTLMAILLVASPLFSQYAIISETKIVFASYRDGNHEIYVMNADGSNQTRLTNDPSFDMAPSWSPDGKKIAFYSLRNDVPPEKDERWWYEMNAEIYVMNADGSEQKNITNNPAYDGYPFWSPLLKDLE